MLGAQIRQAFRLASQSRHVSKRVVARPRLAKTSLECAGVRRFSTFLRLGLHSPAPPARAGRPTLFRHVQSRTLARGISNEQLTALEQLRALTASRNLQFLSIIFLVGSLATVAGMWSEVKTTQIETWVTRVYDTFVLLNGVGKYSVVADDKQEEQSGSEESQDNEDALVDVNNGPSSRSLAEAAADVWKFLLSDEAVRAAKGGFLSWDVVREHPFVAAVAEADVDIADVLAEVSDASGPGVSRSDFVALCGVVYILSRDIRSSEDNELLRSMVTLLALMDESVPLEQAVAAGTISSSVEGPTSAEDLSLEHISVSAGTLRSWLRAMASLGFVKAVNFTDKGATLHPREVADNVLLQLLSHSDQGSADKGENAQAEIAEETAASCPRHLRADVFASDTVMKFLEFDMFRKRNDLKFTGHTLLQEYRRRQRFMYAKPKVIVDSGAEGEAEEVAPAAGAESDADDANAAPESPER